ncbi:hypothetical protein F5141DRAFT_1214970 [Pisolithus sp. B1]|nr:hypothetical protein F5141DRAFT_1214970 [Pisolithus sp. B1]
MFPNRLFNNPWHSWRSPSQLEDVQMVRQNDLFDDEMSSTSDPADHTSSTTALTQSLVGISSSSAQAQAHASNSMLHAAELYGKEEIINKLQRQVQQQGKQNDTVTCLQSDLKQRESKLLGLHQVLDVTLQCVPSPFPLTSEQQVQRGQEQSVQQYEMQFEELWKQFKLSMQSQLDSLQATKMAEIDTCVQEEVTRVSSMLQAEKERELANIEQRYARLKRSTPVAKHLDAEGDPLTGPLPMRPQAGTPSTLNLDAIKQIRKS